MINEQWARGRITRASIFFFFILNVALSACSGSSKKDDSGIETPLLYSKEPNDITGKFYIPPVANPAKGPYVKGELLYPLDNKPTPQCHSSTIVETPSGLVCAFFAGTHEKHPDVGIWVSRLEDGSWTWPEEVANGVQNGTPRHPCWNPVLFLPKNGPLLLFYKVGPSPTEWWGMLTTSNDNGRTWSVANKLGEDSMVGHLLGPVKNKPLQLADGTILCPSSTEIRAEVMGIQWKVHFELTRDLGQTFSVVGPINDGITFDAIQPTVLIHPGGRMQILCRTRQGVVAQSWSNDHGRSWSEMRATELPNPNAGIDGLTLKDGRQLLVYNHTTREGKGGSGRHLLNVAMSEDGNDWIPILTLEDDTRNKAGYSYPAAIQTGDGLVHITYTYERVSIKHVVLNPTLL